MNESMMIFAWVYGEADPTPTYCLLITVLGALWAVSMFFRRVTMAECVALGVYGVIVIAAGLVILRHIVETTTRGSMPL